MRHQSLIFDFCLVSTTITLNWISVFFVDCSVTFLHFPTFCWMLWGVWVVGWILPRFASFYSSVGSVAPRASQQQTSHTFTHCYRSCYVVIWTGLKSIEQSHKKASCRRRSSLCTQQKKQYSCPAPTPAPIFATQNHRGQRTWHDMTPPCDIWVSKKCIRLRVSDVSGYELFPWAFETSLALQALCPLPLEAPPEPHQCPKESTKLYGAAVWTGSLVFSWGITNIRYNMNLCPLGYMYISRYNINMERIWRILLTLWK